MKRPGISTIAVLVPLALAAGCRREAPLPLMGTLERERISVAVEASEPIVRIDVAEGDDVKAGAPLLAFDTRRTDAQLAQAEAEVRRAEAAFDELRHGTRRETLDAARATLSGADAAASNARRERDRLADLRARGLVAQADLDRAETTLRTAQAQAGSSRANLRELGNGARIEDLDQAEAALDAARAARDRLVLVRERLEVRAPRDARVDALPFKLGDQPPLGATAVSLLAGEAPYARVYVPASLRAGLDLQARCQVVVEGISAPYGAHLRSLRADPAFTPYYALSGDDASRLAYRAEIVLDDVAAVRLPAGLPVQADCARREAGATP